MSLLSMASELTGVITSMPFDYAQTCVQRAVLDAYRQNIWSFLTFESNWTSPVWIQTGSVNVTQGSSIVQFDPLIATVAINAIGLVPSAVTQRQFRIGIGTIYNIWQYSAPAGTANSSGSTLTWVSGDTFENVQPGYLISIAGVSFTVLTVAGSGLSLTTTATIGTSSGAAFLVGGIATLDRNYQEPTAAASSFAIFQCYYVSPVVDFKGWADIRDMVNYQQLYTNKDRPWIDLRDPQRTFYYIPTHVVFYQNDLNPASATYGWPMFELWGAPTYVLTWQLYGYRKGFTRVNGIDTPLIDPDSSLPSAMGEDCVMAKARKYAFEWAEANRGASSGNARSGSNFFSLKRDADADFVRLYRDYRRDDRALMDAWHTKFRRSSTWPNREPSYNSIAGVASPGV